MTLNDLLSLTPAMTPIWISYHDKNGNHSEKKHESYMFREYHKDTLGKKEVIFVCPEKDENDSEKIVLFVGIMDK